MKGTGIRLAKWRNHYRSRERTNIDDIYAAGDCALVYHLLKQENAYIPLGTTANKCGRIAGENIGGKHRKFIGAIGSAAIKVFDIEMARTGLSEKEAKELSIDYDTVGNRYAGSATLLSGTSQSVSSSSTKRARRRYSKAQGAGKRAWFWHRYIRGGNNRWSNHRRA